MTTEQTQPIPHDPCREVIELGVRVANLESWKKNTEIDLKAINDTISQVKLLMSLSIGGGALSVVSLIVLIANAASK